MSKRTLGGSSVLAAAILLWVAQPTQAASVLKMDMESLCHNADSIFRGTVVTVEEGTVEAGGSVLPTVTYTLKIGEVFKGTFPSKKGVTFSKITMLGALKAASSDTGLERYSLLPRLPRLLEGQDYLLMTSAPSAIGLSAPIGLGQGCFHISSGPRGEVAVNELGNVGLFDGPVPYSFLAGLIAEAVAPADGGSDRE